MYCDRSCSWQPGRCNVWIVLVGMVVLLLGGGSRGEGNERGERLDRVILVTLDGLRWQELFGGVDARLAESETGVRDVEALRRRFVRDTVAQSRAALMPFMWSEVVKRGQIWGDPASECQVIVSNGKNFSYPGYNELLTGRADPRIDSNAKRPNPNVTILEWLKAKKQLRVSAYCSWDVFPYILNVERSGLDVNAGWQPLTLGDAKQLAQLNRLAQELPRVWPAVRYDVFTLEGALAALKTQRLDVIYVALGETDDWAHEGRYDLYLDAAHRNDRYLRQLWQAARQYRQPGERVAMLITTDHGRGDGRESWKSHGAEIAGCERIWLALLGDGIPASGLVKHNKATQSQVAATIATLLGYDPREFEASAAPPLNWRDPSAQGTSSSQEGRRR